MRDEKTQERLNTLFEVLDIIREKEFELNMKQCDEIEKKKTHEEKEIEHEKFKMISNTINNITEEIRKEIYKKIDEIIKNSLKK